VTVEANGGDPRSGEEAVSAAKALVNLTDQLKLSGVVVHSASVVFNQLAQWKSQQNNKKHALNKR